MIIIIRNIFIKDIRLSSLNLKPISLKRKKKLKMSFVFINSMSEMAWRDNMRFLKRSVSFDIKKFKLKDITILYRNTDNELIIVFGSNVN